MFGIRLETLPIEASISVSPLALGGSLASGDGLVSAGLVSPSVLAWATAFPATTVASVAVLASAPATIIDVVASAVVSGAALVSGAVVPASPVDLAAGGVALSPEHPASASVANPTTMPIFVKARMAL